MDIEIREAKLSDLSEYTDMLQRTYQAAYTKPEIGLTYECFSKEIFNTPNTQEYLKSNLVNSERQKSWVAFTRNKLIGSIAIVRRENEYELRGFYVTSEYQGQGIGKKLFRLALDYAADMDILLDIYAHNTRTIDMYKKWGFEIDKEKGEFYRHWDEWPKNVKAKCIYMRYKHTGK